jgi:predicted phosphodiesterase
MRPIRWLHISDFHLRQRDAWSQDVVLQAMCERICLQRNEGDLADFILATGDLSFSGQVDEYDQLRQFFDELSTASGVLPERIFCVPGNHDVDRERQKLCFLGARHYLQDQNRVDEMLARSDDMTTLLLRQKNYYDFQDAYCKGQVRTWTNDGLGYMSALNVDDVRIVILGLNSAWLAEGGVEDHLKLLMGERQVINAINLAEPLDPHIVIAISHHPFHLLREFDRVVVQNRIERACHFFHCGHLHEPEARNVAESGSGCLTLAAGASFETRQTHNTYSFVTLDLLQGLRKVETIQYNPTAGAFSFTSIQTYGIELTVSRLCNIDELSLAINEYRPSLSSISHYLAALLLDHKSEVPVPAQKSYTLGSFAVLQDQTNSHLRTLTFDFMTFRNVLRVLHNHVPLAEIFSKHGDLVGEYGSLLQRLAEEDPILGTRLREQENDATLLATSEPAEDFSHTTALMDDLAATGDWDLLSEQAQRHITSSNKIIALRAKRMLALAWAHSIEEEQHLKAISLYRSLNADSSAEFTDTGNLAKLLLETGDLTEAKSVVLDGMKRFPRSAGYFLEIGQRIVEATGDRLFRKEIESAIVETGT